MSVNTASPSPVSGASLAALLLFYWSAVTVAEGSLNADSQAQVLWNLTSKFWQWRLQTSPEYGTKFGFHDNDAYLEDLSEASMEQNKNDAETFLDDLMRIDSDKLDHREKINWSVLKDTLNTFITGFQYREYGAYVGLGVFDNPLRDIKSVISWMKFKTETDYRRALQRYRAFIRSLEQRKELIRKALSRGIAGSGSALDATLEYFNNNWPSEPEQTFMYMPFKDIRHLESHSKVTELQDLARNMIANEVTPAVNNFTEFLKKEYKPHVRARAGVSSLPNGKEYYRACLKWHLSLDITPAQIFEEGQREVERIRSNINKIMRADGWTGDLRSYISNLKSSPENVFSGREEMLKAFGDSLKEIDAKISQIIRNVPDAQLMIRNTATGNSPTGRYMEPSLDGSRPGVFYANTFFANNSLRASVMALTLHETVPGHHTQMVYAIEEKIPNFRRAIEYRKYYATPFNWPFYTAYVEGWALYAESLGEEMGLYTTQGRQLGRYTSEILRACRLVIDTGIHEYGWTQQQAMDYLSTHTDLPLKQIQVEVKRYTDYPGQATAYKIGELTIKRLRKKAEKELGDDFDLADFHAIVLQLGPVPLTVLEENIDSWISSRSDRVGAVTDSAHICLRSRLDLVGVTLTVLAILAKFN